MDVESYTTLCKHSDWACRGGNNNFPGQFRLHITAYFNSWTISLIYTTVRTFFVYLIYFPDVINTSFDVNSRLDEFMDHKRAVKFDNYVDMARPQQLICNK